MKGNLFYISIGSNMMDGRERVDRAIDAVSSKFGDVVSSGIYSTKSVRRGDDSIYYNAVVRFVSGYSAEELNEWCKMMENDMGRSHSISNHEVAMDIDVVIMNDEILRPKDCSRDYFLIGLRQIDKI